MLESATVVLFLFVYLFAFGIGLATYLIQAFAIYKMSKNMGFTPWFAFIPVANGYAFGKIAETYVKADGKPSAKFSKILLILQIILIVLLFVLITLAVVLFVLEDVGSYFLDINVEAITISVMMIPLVLSAIGLYAVAIAYNVIFYVALWRIYSLYDNKNANLYLILSILFNVLPCVFLFILRDKEPKFTIEQRTNI